MNTAVAGDRLLTAAETVADVLTTHGLPVPEGDHAGLADALHQYLFGVPMPAPPDQVADRLHRVVADGDCPRCGHGEKVRSRGRADRSDEGPRDLWECGCGWAWSTPAATEETPRESPGRNIDHPLETDS